MSVHGHQIEPSIQIQIAERAPESQAVARRLPDPRFHRHIRIRAALATAIERHHFVVEVRDRDSRRAGVVVIRNIDAHSGPRLPVFAERDSSAHRDIFERAVAQVAIQLIGLRIVRDQNIRPAVPIVIEQRHTQRFRGGIENAALRRDIFKRSVAAIAKQPAGGAVICLRRAVRLALAVDTAINIVLRRPLHIVAYEQIQVSVAVEIEPHRGCTERVSPAQSRLLRHVEERTFARVLK